LILSYFDHAFTAILERYSVGRYNYRLVFLPDEIKANLPFDVYPRLRIEGEVADIPINGAWQPIRDGRVYLMVSPEICKQAAIALGDEVEVRFRVADQNAVEVPDELRVALSDHDATGAWDALTPGKQRGLAYLVASAKIPETRHRRSAEIAGAVKAGDISRYQPPKTRKRGA
jgi:hypothetical protein